MVTSAFPSVLAFFQETTQGTPPANAAAWASLNRQRHIAEDLDVSGIQQAVVEDMRSQRSIFGLNTKVKGLRNIDGVPFSLYATGTGATTASGDPVTEIDLMTYLEHCLGGLHLSNSAAITTVTSQTEFILDDVDDIEPGCYVAVRDADTGLCEPLRVLTVSTLTITVDKAPSFTVTTSDTIEGCATAYIDESVLVDSNGSGGPYTRSYLIQKGLDDSEENFELRGCKTQLVSMEAARGELAKLAFNIFAASFVDGANAPNPSWSGSETGNGPIVVGPDTKCWLQDEGATTDNLIDVAEMSVDFGVPVTPIPTITENQDNMEGRAGYTTQPADTMATLNVVPYDTDWVGDFSADTLKTFRWWKNGVRGQGFAVAFHKCEIAAHPTRGTVEAVSSNNLVLRARPDDVNASADTAALWETKVAIVLF